MTTAAPETSRAKAFREQINDMNIPVPSANRDRVMSRLGFVVAVLGVVLGLVGFLMSRGTENPLAQNDALTLAVLGVSCAVMGSAVFLRYSLAGFLRLWLVRLIHEQRPQ